ncbi:hypothetical protein HK104_007234 [Borealophlyctis nickersoniae]|nr:hypothetical protein HK104_007234 [Borealophlyctis nickersoniae]
MFNWVLRRASNATESIPGGWTANGRDLSWKGTTHSEPPPSPATTKAPPSPDANASPPGDVNPTENVAEDLRSQLAIAQQTKSELAFQVSQLERKVEWLQKSEAEHEKANRELVSELNRLAAEHANSNDQIDVLERELAKSLAVYINEQALHNDTKGKIVQLENAIEVLRGSLTTQSAEGKEAEEVLKEVIKGKDEEILKLAGQLDSRAHELASLKEVLFQAQRDRDGHVSARKLMETQYKAALAELEVANREAAEARKQLAAVRGTGNRDRSMSNVSLRQEGPLSNETAECALELRSALSELQVLLAGIEAERDEYKAMFQRLQAEAVACANEIRGSVKQLNNLPPSTCSLVQERGIVESQVDTHAIEELKAQLKEVIRDRDDARRSLAASQSTTAVNSPASSPRRSIGSEASDTSVNSDDHLNYTVAELKALLKDREQLLAQTTLDFHLLQSYHNQSAAKLSNYTVEELTALLQDRERLLTQTTLDFHLLQSYQSQGAGAGSKYSMEELAALLQDRERLLTQTTLDFHLLQSYQSQGAGATSKYSMEELAALLQDRERLLTQTTLDFHLLQSYQSQGAGAASKYSVEELAALLKDRESLLNQTTLDFHLLQSYQPQPAEKAPKRRSSMKTQDPLRRKSVTFSQGNERLKANC